MTTQTILNVVLSILTLYLAIKNYELTNKKENQRESQEMTEIRVQLNQVMGLLRDMQKDIRTNNADYKALSERVVKLETKIETAFQRIDETKVRGN